MNDDFGAINAEERENDRRDPYLPDACAYCGKAPQAVGLHCYGCWDGDVEAQR